MKKKILLYIFLSIMPITIYADSIKISCPNQVNNNAEFTCELSGDTNTSVSSLSAKINLTDGLSLTAFIPKNVWQGDGLDGNVELYTVDIQNGLFPIGTIKLKKTNNEDSIININSVFFYDEDDLEKNVNDVSATIKVANNNSNNTTQGNNDNKTQTNNSNQSSNELTNNDALIATSYYLADLKIDGYSIDFVREETEYTLKIKDEKSLNITPVLEDNSSSFEILGNSELKNGSVIRIQVKTTDNNIQTYKITIEKENESISKKNYTNIFIIIIVVLILVNIVRIIVNERKKIGGGQNE